MRVRSLSREDLLEKEMATHSGILAGKFHGQRSLAGFSPWGHKELDTTKRTHILGTTFLSPQSEPGCVTCKQTQNIRLRSQPQLTEPGSPWRRNVLTACSSCPWTSYWCSHWPQQRGFGKPVPRITSQVTEHVDREDARRVQWKFLKQREMPGSSPS